MATTLRALGQQRQGERAEPRAHLEDHVIGRQVGQTHDPAHRARIDHEVLAKPFGRPDAETAGQVANVGRSEQAG